MACGYQMAAKAFQRDLGGLAGLGQPAVQASWPFVGVLGELTSTAPATARRDVLLRDLPAGSKVHI